MKSQYRTIFAFVALLLAISLACSGGASPAPTTTIPIIPTNPPPPTSAPQDLQVNPSQQSGTSSDLVTFVDQNNLLAFDLPGDWYYEHEDLGREIYTDATTYRDTFTAPDESAKMESLVLFADNEVNNSASQAVALDILNTYYSSTGKNNGDIRISSDQIMKDGSERFEWISKGGGYSGVTFFEVRGDDRTTWLMLTAWWDNNADQAILDTINNAISSYYIPQ